MKILFISRASSVSAGGMERFSYALIRTASKHPTLTVTKIIHRGSRKTSPLFALLIIPKAIFVARNFDVVHIGDPMLSAVGWFIKFILRKKVVVTVHGLDVTYSNALYQLYLRLFFRSLDIYLPISNAVKVELDKHAVKGKVMIISPGISNDYFDPYIERSELIEIVSRQGFDASPTNVYLLTTGRLVKRKGHAWFIQNVLSRLPSHVHYIVAGDGPEKENILKVISESQLQKRVHILGRVSDDDLKVLYNTVDAFVQPNIKVEGDMEGFGLVLLEAALCNRPVFAADLEGMTDAVISGRNGTLLPSGNSNAWVEALTSLKFNPVETRAFTLENYSWQSYVDKLVAVIKA